MSLKWVLKNKTVIFLHIIAWLLFFSVPILIHSPVVFHHKGFAGGGAFHTRPTDIAGIPRFEWFPIITDLLLVGVFYLNAYVLLSGFIIKRRIWRSLGIQILIFLGFFLINLLIMNWTMKDDVFFHSVTTIAKNHFRMNNHNMPPPRVLDRGFIHAPIMPFLFRNSLPYFFIITSSIAYRMVIDRIKADRLAKERENENLKTELLLLRSQISPHFMFNVLNNMVSLARKGSDQLESSLIKLSGIMRYM